MSSEEKEYNKSILEVAHKAGIGIILATIGYGLAFIFQVVAARYFGSDGFGQFTLAKTFLLIGATIASLGIMESVARYIPYYRAEKKFTDLTGFVRFICSVPLLLSFIVGAALYLLAPLLTNFFGYPELFINALRIVAVAVPFRMLTMLTRRVLLAEKLVAHQQTSVNLVENFVLLVGIGVLILLNMNVVMLIALLLVMYIATSVYGTIVLLQKSTLSVRGKGNLRVSEWIAFSAPLFLTSIFSLVIGWTDNILIGKFLEPSQLGVYAIVYSFAHMLTFFQNGIANIFMPVISGYGIRKPEQTKKLFTRSASWILLLTVPITLVMILYAQDVLNLVYGSEYIAGYTPLVILAVGALINVSTGLSAQMLIAIGRTKEIFWTNSVIGVANLGLNLVLIPYIGIIGAAIASAASMASQNLILFMLARKSLKLRLDMKHLGKVLLAGIIAITLAAATLQTPFSLYWRLGLSGVVYGLTYLAGLFFLRVVTKEDALVVSAVERRIGRELTWLRKVYNVFR